MCTPDLSKREYIQLPSTTAYDGMTIPRRIFQTWKSRHVENPVLKMWQHSWTAHNPHFGYELWDDDDNRKFVQTHFPNLLTVYDAYDKNICRADAIRYLYLYTFGGVYADLDFECIRPFEPLLQFLDNNNSDIALGSINTDAENSLHSIPNALMISRPNVHFWEFVIDALSKTRKFNLNPELQTGPIFLKLCLIAYMEKSYDKNLMENLYGNNIFSHLTGNNSKIFIFEQSAFYPINWADTENFKNHVQRPIPYRQEELRELFPKSVAVTYWMHSWGDQINTSTSTTSTSTTSTETGTLVS